MYILKRSQEPYRLELKLLATPSYYHSEIRDAWIGCNRATIRERLHFANVPYCIITRESNRNQRLSYTLATTTHRDRNYSSTNLTLAFLHCLTVPNAFSLQSPFENTSFARKIGTTRNRSRGQCRA